STKSHGYRTRFETFSGNSAIISRKFQFAMKGIDAEAGVHVKAPKDWDFYVGAGPYAFHGDMGKNAWGGKARLLAKASNPFALEVSESYDTVFGNIVQGEAFLIFPMGPKARVRKGRAACLDNCTIWQNLSERIVQPTFRQEIVVVNSGRKNSIAIDPATGLPI